MGNILIFKVFMKKIIELDYWNIINKDIKDTLYFIKNTSNNSSLC